MKYQNHKLIEARKKLGLTQKKVADAIGISHQMYHFYENLVKYPGIKAIIRVISFYSENGINLTIDEIFPEASRRSKVSTNKTKEDLRSKILPLKEANLEEIELATASEETPLDLLLERENNANLSKKYLSFLNPRESGILTLRYLTNGKKFTHKEIGQILGISQTWVDKLEKRGLKKLADLIQAG